MDLARWLPGRYSTAAHAAADEKAQTAHRHIRAVLNITPVSVEGLEAPAPYQSYYLEQALAEAPDKPYRQRVIVLQKTEAGLWQNVDYRVDHPPVNGRFQMDQLRREPGCEVLWTRVDEHLFKGSAGQGKTCRSALRGATHVVSYSELTPSTLTSLDQGFDDTGAHKWGPPPGVIGHIFRKQEVR